MSILTRVQALGLKRLVALDGAGVRGALTIEILADIEDLLRRETAVSGNFVLAQRNLDLPLRQLVRARTAAPHNFPAEAIEVGAITSCSWMAA